VIWQQSDADLELARPMRADRSTTGASLESMAAPPDPRRPEVEAPAPIDDAEIYQLDGKFPLVRWLCADHVKAWKDRGWTVKPGAADGAGKPPWCSDCELARQAR
jgi:hypothetical protein